MKQEDKELLLKDVCSRLPYKLVCEVKYKEEGKYKTSNMVLSGVFTNEAYFTSKEGSIYSTDYKPYLFPLSSMTEEQRNEFDTQTFKIMFGECICKKNDEMAYGKLMKFDLDFYNKNHLDWIGLIPMGLALDATNKKIY